MIKRMSIGELKLHDIEDSTLPYFLGIPIKGLEFPSLRVNSYNKAGRDGINVNGIYFGERRVSLTGTTFNAQSMADHVALRRAFLSALAPQRDSNGLLTHKTLRFTTLDGEEYRLMIEVVSADMQMNYNHHSVYYIDVLATSENIESLEEISGVITTQTRGGFVLPVQVPILFSAGTGGQVTLTNNGDQIAKPIVTLAGPLTNPRLANVTTGEFLAITHTIGDGEEFEIDMALETIMQGGITNRIDKMTGGDFFGLAPGENVIKLTTGINGEGGSATFKYRHAYIGV